MRIRAVVIALLVAIAGPALAQNLTHGKLRAVRPGHGRIDLGSGSAEFSIRGWELLPNVTSDGISPATEPITIGIAEERFLIPVGQLKVSRNGRRFRYQTQTDRGVRKLLLIQKRDGTFRMTLSLAGVDLSALVIQDLPLCMPFALIIGNDDGFSGVKFLRPRPSPSQRLDVPGSCTDTQSWPWA